MRYRWIHESPAKWDQSKKRMIGEAPEGIFDERYRSISEGELLPGEWWRVEDEGEVVGYGWLDVVWGDAEILLASSPKARRKGVGSYILEELSKEARVRGLNYLHNVVPKAHPQRAELTAWLEKRGFTASEDGKLLRYRVRSA